MSEIIVFEDHPYWTPELQRQFAGAEIRVRLCSQTGDVLKRIDRCADPCRPVVVLQLDGKEAGCLQLLPSLFSRRIRSLVIASARTAELEAPVRELGATSFFDTRPSGRELAARCRRQWHSSNASD